MVKQQDLFIAPDDNAARNAVTMASPLAERVRPTRLESFEGQDHLVGPGGAIRLALERGEIPSFVLHSLGIIGDLVNKLGIKSSISQKMHGLPTFSIFLNSIKLKTGLNLGPSPLKLLFRKACNG